MSSLHNAVRSHDPYHMESYPGKGFQKFSAIKSDGKCRNNSKTLKSTCQLVFLMVRPGFHSASFDHDHDQFWVKTKQLVGRMTAQPHNRKFLTCSYRDNPIFSLSVTSETCSKTAENWTSPSLLRFRNFKFQTQLNLSHTPSCILLKLVDWFHSIWSLAIVTEPTSEMWTIKNDDGITVSELTFSQNFLTVQITMW